jgi:hypothetical protein
MDCSVSPAPSSKAEEEARSDGVGWGGEEEGSGAVAFIGRGRENAVRIAESVSEYVHPPQFGLQTFLKTEDSVHGDAYDFRIQRSGSRFCETDIA